MNVTLDDVMSAHGCAVGTLKFLKRHDMDYRKFFRDGGLPIEQFEAIDDAMVKQVIAQTRKRYDQGDK